MKELQITADNIITCTKEVPWDGVKRQGVRVRHPDAVSVEIGSDYFDAYKCPHCGQYFEVELPE